MKVIAIALVGALLVATGPAKAQQSDGKYCMAAAGYLNAGNDEDMIKQVAVVCSPGDTISIPPGGAIGLVARLCDFSKPIVIVDRSAVCVLGALRPVR